MTLFDWWAVVAFTIGGIIAWRNHRINARMWADYFERRRQRRLDLDGHDETPTAL